MINLDEILVNNPRVSLLEPRDSTATYIPRVRLLLVDEHGEARELTIDADAFIEPRVAPMLVFDVADVQVPEFSDEPGEYNPEHCPLCSHSGGMMDGDGICWTPTRIEGSGEPEPCGCRCPLNVFTEIAPPVEWCVTPSGESVDLRSDGLFG
jgi:hypothetical protein